MRLVPAGSLAIAEVIFFILGDFLNARKNWTYWQMFPILWLSKISLIIWSWSSEISIMSAGRNLGISRRRRYFSCSRRDFISSSGL